MRSYVNSVSNCGSNLSFAIFIDKREGAIKNEQSRESWRHWEHKIRQTKQKTQHPIHTTCVSSVYQLNPEDHLCFLIDTKIRDFVKDHDYTCTCWCNRL